MSSVFVYKTAMYIAKTSALCCFSLPCLFFLFSSMALALDKDLGQFYRFYAHVYRENTHKVCNTYSRPNSQSGTERGKQVSLNITSRPALGKKHKISINMGATVKEAVPVILTVDNKVFKLFSYKTFAFPRDEDEKALLQKIKYANSMVVQATLKTGKQVKDTYSLRGLLLSLRVIDKMCAKP